MRLYVVVRVKGQKNINGKSNVSLCSSRPIRFRGFYYNTEMLDKGQNKSIMNNLEFNRNFGISHGKFHYCKSNNLLEEEKNGLIGL